MEIPNSFIEKINEFKNNRKKHDEDLLDLS